MNRAIITGSVIVGIAVMMIVSLIGPAYAASPWTIAWFCKVTGGDFFRGSLEFVTDDGKRDCDVQLTDFTCSHPSGVSGKEIFKDSNRDGEFTNDEQLRCQKS